MKKLIFTAVCIFLITFSFAAPVIKLQSINGVWRTASNWDLNRLPSNGDTIIIPAGKTAIIDNNINAAAYQLFIKVYGTLFVDGGGSKLILGSGSTIQVLLGGIVLGSGNNSEIIKIGNNTVYQGTLPAVVGPMYATSSTSNFQSFSENTLPVKFVGFTLTRRNADMLVQWSTSEEVNAAMYELERSYNAAEWNTIAYINAIGNSKVLNNYSFTDKGISSKIVYYRIKQVDVDGRFTYTSVKSAKLDKTEAANINIASVQGKLMLQFQNEIIGNVTVRLVSLNGQVTEQHIVANAIGQVVLNVKHAGNYVISVTNGQDVNLAKQVIL